MTLEDIKKNKKKFIVGAATIVAASTVIIIILTSILERVSNLGNADDPKAIETITFRSEPTSSSELENMENLTNDEQLQKKKQIGATPTKEKRDISFSSTALEKSLNASKNTEKSTLKRSHPTTMGISNQPSSNISDEEEIKRQIEQIYSNDSKPNNSTLQSSSSTTPNSPSQQKLTTEEDIIKAKKERYEHGFKSSSTLQITSHENYTKYVKCIVHGTQTLRANQVITMRLTEPTLSDNGIVIPRHTLLYGTVVFNNNRAHINISSININNDIYPFTRQVVALDGLPGIGLNQSNFKKDMEKSIGDATNQQVQQVMKKTAITSVIGGITNDISNSMKREKTQEITLIDTYQLYISPIKKQ